MAMYFFKVLLCLFALMQGTSYARFSAEEKDLEEREGRRHSRQGRWLREQVFGEV